VFVGFRLHSPPAKPAIDVRREHLARARLVRCCSCKARATTLAELPLLRPVVAALGSRATLHLIDGADHGFSRKPDVAAVASTIGELGSIMMLACGRPTPRATPRQLIGLPESAVRSCIRDGLGRSAAARCRRSCRFAICRRCARQGARRRRPAARAACAKELLAISARLTGRRETLAELTVEARDGRVIVRGAAPSAPSAGQLALPFEATIDPRRRRRAARVAARS